MLSKTYLLYGDKRINLKDKAYDFAKDIFKNNNININNQDIVYYENIKIADVREIIEKSAESSYSGLKIFILNLIGIRVEASNALLKVIEEPNKNTVFILLSNNLKLEPTILSRAVKYKLSLPKFDVSLDIYNFFDGNEEYINEYLKNSIKLSDYKINNMDELLNSIEQYYSNNESIYSKISYEYAIIYLITKMKYEKDVEKIKVIQYIIDKIDNDREKTIEIMSKILLKCNIKLNESKYVYLLNIKNSIKNNVSTKYAMYIFLNVLFE